MSRFVLPYVRLLGGVPSPAWSALVAARRATLVAAVGVAALAERHLTVLGIRLADRLLADFGRPTRGGPRATQTQ
jgi:hypothetical protein